MQVNLPQMDKSRIKVKLIPAIQEVITKWLMIHFMGTVPTTQPSLEDFGSRLSLLNIGMCLFVFTWWKVALGGDTLQTAMNSPSSFS